MRWWQAETQARQAGSFRGRALAPVTAPVLLAGGFATPGRQAACPKNKPQGCKGGLGVLRGEGHAEERGQKCSFLVVATEEAGDVVSQVSHTDTDHGGTTCPAVRAWGAICQACKIQAQERTAS